MTKHIEELVGIRAVVGKNHVSRSGLGTRIPSRGVSPARKAVRTRDPTWRPYEKSPWDMVVDDVGNQVDDAFMGSSLSPFMSRVEPGLASIRAHGSTCYLANLEEEGEWSKSTEDRKDNEMRSPKRQWGYY